MRRKACQPVRLLVWLLVVTFAGRAAARHPFPASPGERDKARQILEAVAAGNQNGVKALAELLGDENPRVQTAALVGLLRLSHKELDFAPALARVRAWRGPRPPFLRAALSVAEVALNTQTPLMARLGALIELTKSERGFERRMAVEALRGRRAHRVPSKDIVLQALAALANDPFADTDADFDGKAVGRLAFEVWWALRSHNVDQDERPPMLLEALRAGEPYASRWGHAACDVLARRGQEAVPLLLPLLGGKDRRSKLWAMRALADIGGAKAIAALQDSWIRELDGGGELERDVARRSLLRHPDWRVLPPVVREAVRDDEVYAAWKAVHGLGKLEDDEALPRLREAAQDHREVVRMQAAAQLAHRGQGDGELTILTGLTSGTDIVRLIARWGLPKLPDRKKVHEHVIELLKVKPDEDKLPEKTRDCLQRVRLDLLQDIYAWDRERQDHLPLVYAISDLLEHPRYAGWAAKILRKLGHKVTWRDGRYHAKIQR